MINLNEKYFLQAEFCNTYDDKNFYFFSRYVYEMFISSY